MQEEQEQKQRRRQRPPTRNWADDENYYSKRML